MEPQDSRLYWAFFQAEYEDKVERKGKRSHSHQSKEPREHRSGSNENEEDHKTNMILPQDRQPCGNFSRKRLKISKQSRYSNLIHKQKVQVKLSSPQSSPNSSAANRKFQCIRSRSPGGDSAESFQAAWTRKVHNKETNNRALDSRFTLTKPASTFLISCANIHFVTLSRTWTVADQNVNES